MLRSRKQVYYMLQEPDRLISIWVWEPVRVMGILAHRAIVRGTSQAGILPTRQALAKVS